MILGDSGSGKSTSLRNFAEDEICILNVASKPLPFRGKMKYRMDGSDYLKISKAVSNPPTKVVAIDDSQYLMSFEFFDRAKETGYQKFTDIALNFRNLIDSVVRFVPPDVIVYFLHHTDTAADGKVRAKTIGKMLDEKLTVEGLFSIVLLCKTDGDRHYFETQSDGYSTVKSPIGMFENKEIDNDLKFVDQTIRAYWDMDETEKGADE